jgi:NADH dehydrogenase/NADH:ubiquinone oxidoreductase subunit G
VKVSVDNLFYKVFGDKTIFQFCSDIGLHLPCFCYHEKLSIAGNCRMCLVQANSGLVVSCAMSLIDNMQIVTNNKRIRMAREGILEFLLVNHPLDCPICDQGGECDLQDITLVFGSDRGRFYEFKKRSVDNINCCGPFIKTVMTRCIHCTRCVRFLSEVIDDNYFGALGRGVFMEIGTYIENYLTDEMSANVIDLCPLVHLRLCLMLLVPDLEN